MKLNAEYENVLNRVKEIEHKIQPYAEHLKQAGEYKDFEKRLAWDVLRAVTPSQEICTWYDKYGCNDNHITTLAKRVLKNFYTC